MIDAVKGVVIGILMGIIILYSLSPKTAYPPWMLVPYEHPWLFLVLSLIAIYALTVDKVIGSLLVIIVASLILDFHLLAKKRIMGWDDHNDLVISSEYRSYGRQDDNGDRHDGYPEVYDLATIDTEGEPLHNIPLDIPVYPMFDDSDMGFNPEQPSPF
jgi:hypothetical protein